MRPLTFWKTFAILAVVVAVLAVYSPARTAGATSTLVVPTQYVSIQAAVNAASNGDTIKVLPGTYAEQVSIGKNLAIKGSGALVTTVRAPAVLVPGSLGRAFLVDIHSGANVGISGVTLSGPGPDSCAGTRLGAAIKVVEGATLDLSAARVLHIHNTPKQDCFHTGTGIAIGDFVAGEIGHATIHDVRISDYQSNAISVFTPGSDATITGNVLNAAIGPSDAVSTGGVEVGNGAVARVTYNVVNGNRCSLEVFCGSDPMTQSQGAGLLDGPGAPPAAGSEFAHNVVSGNDIGIYMFTGCCNINHNLVVNNQFFGIAIQDTTNDVSHDVIIGGQVGVGVIADAVDSVGTLRGEVILGTSVAKTKEIACCGFTAKVITLP